MIREKMCAECDLCGVTVLAKKTCERYSGVIYDIPDGWTKSPCNREMHLCPECTAVVKAMYARRRVKAEEAV